MVWLGSSQIEVRSEEGGGRSGMAGPSLTRYPRSLSKIILWAFLGDFTRSLERRELLVFGPSCSLLIFRISSRKCFSLASQRVSQVDHASRAVLGGWA